MSQSLAIHLSCIAESVLNWPNVRLIWTLTWNVVVLSEEIYLKYALIFRISLKDGS